ncbi:MAG: phospho-sugar mutase, partial [Christensenellales bacterium]
GLGGMNKMKNIMDFARNKNLDSIAGVKVIAKNDLSASVKTYADGKTETINLPKTNAIKWNLDGGDWICVRPSGTEPKLKIYVATKASSKEKATAVAESYVSFMKDFLS